MKLRVHKIKIHQMKINRPNYSYFLTFRDRKNKSKKNLFEKIQHDKILFINLNKLFID